MSSGSYDLEERRVKTFSPSPRHSGTFRRLTEEEQESRYAPKSPPHSPTAGTPLKESHRAEEDTQAYAEKPVDVKFAYFSTPARSVASIESKTDQSWDEHETAASRSVSLEEGNTFPRRKPQLQKSKSLDAKSKSLHTKSKSNASDKSKRHSSFLGYLAKTLRKRESTSSDKEDKKKSKKRRGSNTSSSSNDSSFKDSRNGHKTKRPSGKKANSHKEMFEVESSDSYPKSPQEKKPLDDLDKVTALIVGQHNSQYDLDEVTAIVVGGTGDTDAEKRVPNNEKTSIRRVNGEGLPDSSLKYTNFNSPLAVEEAREDERDGQESCHSLSDGSDIIVDYGGTVQIHVKPNAKDAPSPESQLTQPNLKKVPEDKKDSKDISPDGRKRKDSESSTSSSSSHPNSLEVSHDMPLPSKLKTYKLEATVVIDHEDELEENVVTYFGPVYLNPQKDSDGDYVQIVVVPGSDPSLRSPTESEEDRLPPKKKERKFAETKMSTPDLALSTKVTHAQSSVMSSDTDEGPPPLPITSLAPVIDGQIAFESEPVVGQGDGGTVREHADTHVKSEANHLLITPPTADTRKTEPASDSATIVPVVSPNDVESHYVTVHRPVPQKRRQWPQIPGQENTTDLSRSRSISTSSSSTSSSSSAENGDHHKARKDQPNNQNEDDGNDHTTEAGGGGIAAHIRPDGKRLELLNPQKFLVKSKEPKQKVIDLSNAVKIPVSSVGTLQSEEKRENLIYKTNTSPLQVQFGENKPTQFETQETCILTAYEDGKFEPGYAQFPEDEMANIEIFDKVTIAQEVAEMDYQSPIDNSIDKVNVVIDKSETVELVSSSQLCFEEMPEISLVDKGQQKRMPSSSSNSESSSDHEQNESKDSRKKHKKSKSDSSSSSDKMKDISEQKNGNVTHEEEGKEYTEIVENGETKVEEQSRQSPMEANVSVPKANDVEDNKVSVNATISNMCETSTENKLAVCDNHPQENGKHFESDKKQHVTSHRCNLNESTSSSSSSSSSSKPQVENVEGIEDGREKVTIDICICQPEQTAVCENDSWEAVHDALKNAEQYQTFETDKVDSVSDEKEKDEEDTTQDKEEDSSQHSESDKHHSTTTLSGSVGGPDGYLPEMPEGMEPDESVKPWVPPQQDLIQDNSSLKSPASEIDMNIQCSESLDVNNRKDAVAGILNSESLDKEIKDKSSTSSSSSSSDHSSKCHTRAEKTSAPIVTKSAETEDFLKGTTVSPEETIDQEEHAEKVRKIGKEPLKPTSSSVSESSQREQITTPVAALLPTNSSQQVTQALPSELHKTNEMIFKQETTMTPKSSGDKVKDKQKIPKEETHPIKVALDKPTSDSEADKSTSDIKGKEEDPINTSTSSAISSGDSIPTKRKSKLFSWPFKWHKKKSDDKSSVDSDKSSIGKAPKTPTKDSGMEKSEPKLPRTSTPLKSTSASEDEHQEQLFHQSKSDSSKSEAAVSVQSTPTKPKRKERSASSVSSSSSKGLEKKRSGDRRSSTSSGASTPKTKRSISPEDTPNTTYTRQDSKLAMDQTASVDSNFSCHHKESTPKQQSISEHHISESRSSSISSVEHSELSDFSKEVSAEAFADPLLVSARKVERGQRKKKKNDKVRKESEKQPDSAAATSQSEISELDTSIASDAHSQQKREKLKKKKEEDKRDRQSKKEDLKKKKIKDGDTKESKDKDRKNTRDKQKETRDMDKKMREEKIEKVTSEKNKNKSSKKKSEKHENELEGVKPQEDAKEKEKEGEGKGKMKKKEKDNSSVNEKVNDNTEAKEKQKPPDSPPQKPSRKRSKKKYHKDGTEQLKTSQDTFLKKDIDNKDKCMKEKRMPKDGKTEQTEKEIKSKKIEVEDMKPELEKGQNMNQRKKSTNNVKSDTEETKTRRRSRSRSSSSPSSSADSDDDGSKVAEEVVSDKKDITDAKETKRQPTEMPIQPPNYDVFLQASTPPQEDRTVQQEHIELSLQSPNEVLPDDIPSSPVRPPRGSKSQKSGKLQKFLPSLRTSTKKGLEKENNEKLTDPRHFDGQYHREDDVTQGVSEQVAKRVKKPKRTPSEREDFQYADAFDISSPTEPPVYSEPRHFVVVAVDFGTTHSGYAFSFVRDPNSVYMMRRWAGEEPGVVNQKTLTSLLLTPEGEFHSFGYSARSNYLNLVPLEARHWLYFSTFKMELHHNAELNRETMIVAANGIRFSALKVFAHSLEFFKNHALQQLSDQSGTELLNEDIRWVITVPAIWKAPAKQFMRQAAYEAGMASPSFPEQLLIALEPEAASIYCRRLRLHQLVPEQPVKRPLQSPSRASAELINADPAVTELTVGSRYLIVDCGGGTVDITVHELNTSGHIVELHRATGGPHGSTGVDLEFERLLYGVFGIEFVEHYKRKYPMGWVHLVTDFESRKRSASPFKSTSLNVSPPFTFINDFKKHKCDPETAVKRYDDSEIEWSPQGMLRLSPIAMRKLFLPTVSQIKQAVGDVLNHPNARDLKYLFLVGGFAESPILQNEMRMEFGNLIKILIPQEVSLAILKGAVLFGIDPSVVYVRRSRLTYGVGILNRFDPKRHPPSKRVRRDGVDWCTDIFDKYVETDQPVMLGNSVVRSYTPAKSGQISIVLNVYSSVNPNVRFITDPGVTRCGTLCLSLPVLSEDLVGGATGGKPHPPREIQTRMSFGDTEINVVAIDVVTGRVVKASIDFLGR